MKTWFAGELLMRLECENQERFGQAEHFRVRYTGAEANAAVAMASVGAKKLGLISAVPDNPIGESCLASFKHFGIDTSHVVMRDPGGRLGLFFLETGAGLRPSQVVYDRAGSVFSQTPAEDYKLSELFSASDWIHLSGTLPALSPVTLDLTKQLIAAAKQAGATVSFDLNYRSKLWAADEAAKVFKQITEQIDVLIANASVAESFLGVRENQLCSRYSLKCAALTRRGAESANSTTFGGSLYRNDGSFHDVRPIEIPVTDRIGGGDAFAGGMIFALQQQDWDDEKRIRFAVACGALKHSIRGDFSLSTREEIESCARGESFAVRR